MAVAAPSYIYDVAAARGRQIMEIIDTLVATVADEGAAVSDRHMACGKIHEIEQVYAQARARYEEVLATNPAHLEARIRLALIHLKTGQRARGLAIAHQAAADDPRYTFRDISGRPRSVQTVLADALRDNGDLDRAKAAYAAAVEIVPDDRYAATQLAQILIEENDVERAAELTGQFLEDKELGAFRATLNLLSNDPHRLPAIAGVVTNYAFATASHV